jgi:hypothetical protein
MNAPMGAHEPRPEFRSHLEWQIESALRRETRFAAPVAASMPRLRAVLMIAAAVAIGGIAVIASEQVQDARQRDLLIESARSEEALVRVRLDLARADFQDARRRYEVGTAGPETVLAAERQMRSMEKELKRIQLDLEEIRATSAAPRNELNAPVVGQRDFVRERLALDLETAQHALVGAERAVAEARQRMEVGTAPPAARLAAEAELAQARARMQLVRAMLDLRSRALRGEIPPDDVAPTLRRTELTVHRERVQREIELLRRRVEEARSRVEIGLTSQLELKRAEVELLEREVELQRIRRELETLPAARR